MAAGDVINGIQTAAFTFQPAAGVEIILTAIGMSANNWIYATNGTNQHYWWYFTSAGGGGGSNLKTPINNTIYLQITHAAGGFYSGIQTK